MICICIRNCNCTHNMHHFFPTTCYYPWWSIYLKTKKNKNLQVSGRPQLGACSGRLSCTPATTWWANLGVQGDEFGCFVWKKMPWKQLGCYIQAEAHEIWEAAAESLSVRERWKERCLVLQLPGHTVEVGGDPKESTVSYAVCRKETGELSG